jgi:hypothetical protein
MVGLRRWAGVICRAQLEKMATKLAAIREDGEQCPEAAVLLACVAKVLEMERIQGREGIQ